MLTVVLLGISLILLCVWIAWEHLKLCQTMSLIPGPKAWPIVGNATQFKTDPYEFFLQLKGWADDYQSKGIFILWLCNKPSVIVYKPEYVEVLLSSQTNITKSPLYIFFHKWLGTGLLTSTGNKWKSRRRLLTPTFHFKILNEFVSIHRKQADILVELLQERSGKGEFDIVPYITFCVLDIICETSMGVDTKSQLGGNTEYTEQIFNICDLIQERQKYPWLWPDIIYKMTSSGRNNQKAIKILHDFTNQVIDERIQRRKEQKLKNGATSGVTEIYSSSNRRIRAFLDILLEEYDEGNITREGVREEVDTFMFEGHDTTSSSLQWAIHLLGHHPEVQSRVQQEVDAFYESVEQDGNIKPEQLKSLNYLECVLKEALRLFPPVPYLGRELTQEIKFGPYHVPAGCTVFAAPVALHRNPYVWDDPDKFNPDRFLSDACIGRHPFAYVPFSAGPRNCIGQKFAMMEEKIILASILRRFNITSTQVTDDMRKTSEIIFKPMEGVMVTLETRNLLKT